MLLQMALGLAAASVIAEGFIAWHLPIWRRITERFRILDIVFSFFLSWVMGKMFGAEGVVIAMAAVVSTVVSMPLYPAMRWYEDNQTSLRASAKRGKELTHDTFRIFIFALKVITFPLWSIRRLRQWADRQQHPAPSAS